ncbi:copper chaperone for superoxide dismutase, chloroplastic [Iris pallida]|uniref:Copper chaperone for superoxide dismutase, chloroplastic n=1 Tax=Iris pallida TaxID=29817 RepID=A0AAX6GWW4_IRIPA|nr:copper chaperone for superoxide dismutase, chloroplastic [Iris pallida]
MVSFVRTFTRNLTSSHSHRHRCSFPLFFFFPVPKEGLFFFLYFSPIGSKSQHFEPHKTLDYSRPALRMDSQAATIAKPAADEVKAGVLPELMVRRFGFFLVLLCCC